MDVEQDTTVQKGQDATAERAPSIHLDSQRLPTDSMVTVPLSETDGAPAAEHDAVSQLQLQRPEITIEDEKTLSSRPSSSEIMEAFGSRRSHDETTSPTLTSPTTSLSDQDAPKTPTSADRSRANSNGSDQSAHVDWAELEKKEEQEPQEEGQDEVSSKPNFPNLILSNNHRQWPFSSRVWSRRTMPSWPIRKPQRSPPVPAHSHVHPRCTS